jgi:hypothetical protein
MLDVRQLDGQVLGHGTQVEALAPPADIDADPGHGMTMAC